MYGDAAEVPTEERPFVGRKVIVEDLNAIFEPVVQDGYDMVSGYQETLKNIKSEKRREGMALAMLLLMKLELNILSPVLFVQSTTQEKSEIQFGSIRMVWQISRFPKNTSTARGFA